MTSFGYTLMTEQAGPRELIDHPAVASVIMNANDTNNARLFINLKPRDEPVDVVRGDRARSTRRRMPSAPWCAAPC